MSQSDIPLRESEWPGDSESIRVFTGRTGIGREVVVDRVGSWLDFRYIDATGEIAGFSLNLKYGAEIAVALVGVIAERAQ